MQDAPKTLPARPREAQVRRYFDRIAAEYARRAAADSFHRHLYRQRLEVATRGLELEGKTILDIGAGTGVLYDFLEEKGIDADYYACDISAAMLAQSRIPPERRRAGRAGEVNFPLQRFDCIFLLGVSNYQDEKAFMETLQYIRTHLTEGGIAVLSFTNASSADYRLRQRLRPFIHRFFPGRGVLSQDFASRAYTPAEVSRLLPAELSLPRTVYFNPILPPWERLTPKLHRTFAEWAMRRLTGSQVAPLLFGDFVIIIQ